MMGVQDVRDSELSPGLPKRDPRGEVKVTIVQ